MSAPESARAHLTKAREFLAAAEVNREQELYNAATSNAVTSAINSKDVICLALTGRSGRGDNHDEARAELRAAGPAGRALEPTFGRLLRLKSKAQHLEVSVPASEALNAVAWASRLLDGAQEVVSG